MPMRNKTARQHNFATVPRADIPRSKFRMRQTRKMAFDASLLIPIMCEEVLPGDHWEHRESLLARLATPIAPLLDDLDIETFYFFVPIRILEATPITDWQSSYWEGFISGDQNFGTTPKVGAPEVTGTWPVDIGTLFDYFGLPTGTFTNQYLVLAFPIWAYFQIWNDWFRDQNLQDLWGYTEGDWDNIATINAVPVPWDGLPLRVNKRHDYFTSSLPWPQKGDAVELPLGTTAPVVSNGLPPNFEGSTWPGPAIRSSLATLNASAAVQWTEGAAGSTDTDLIFGNETGLEVDLASATAATINAMRLAFQTQKLLERDARGGSRYVEQLLSHFGVRSPDYRLQRPEYLGGSKIPVTINPIAQTAAYDAEPADAASAVGNLGAEMHASHSGRTFRYAATEHGYIIGLATVRSTPTYQQGIRRHWRRDTRLDYYWPVFAMLGEQAVNTEEIFAPLNGVLTNPTWGYQERWAEYRYTPNEICGVLRSAAAQPMDWWHLSEEFATEPALNAEFITDKTQETLTRSLATAPSAQWSAQVIMDILHDSNVARLMPTYSVPGLIDHF